MSEVRYELVTLLDETGMSQAELSRRTGISTASISQYAAGVTDMSASNVIKIAQALGVTTDRLLGTGFDSAMRSGDSSLNRLLVTYASLDKEQREMLVRIAGVIAG